MIAILQRAEEKIENGFDSIQKPERKSLLEDFVKDKPELYQELKERSWVRLYYEIAVDMFGDSIISRLL